MKRLNWDSMRWPMNFKCWWVIVGNCCDCQQHVVRCSGSGKSLDNWTALYLYWRTVLSHFHFSPRCHILSSASWCNMAPSFHEYVSVGHQLHHQWHHHSLNTSHNWIDVWGKVNTHIVDPCAHKMSPENSIISPIHIINCFPLICTFWHILWVRSIVIISIHKLHLQPNLIPT